MFNGFSAIEQLIKMASIRMSKFRRMVDDAETEYFALRNAAQQGVQRTASNAFLLGVMVGGLVSLITVLVANGVR